MKKKLNRQEAEILSFKHCPRFNVFFQGITKWRNCRLIPKTPEYQYDWAVLAASRLQDLLKHNFYFIE